MTVTRVPLGAAGVTAGTRTVLDVRGGTAFAAGHLERSGHVPAAELAARRAELPARDRPLLVVAEGPERALAAATALAGLGYADVAWLDAAPDEHPLLFADRGRAARLWRPAPFLEEVLPRLTPGRALDVAAGQGRDAVFLAMHGFAVEAWDHAPEALDAACALAARHGVTIETVVCDLEREPFRLPEGRFDLVVCFRFLHRPLFPWIERALAPGGRLVYETYRSGQERYGRPLRAQFLLREGELTAAFPSLAVEHYAELEPAGGPVTARLLARRPR
jgi:SAM-dependent methyltransferase